LLDTAVSACILSILYIYILLCVYNQERGALAFDTTVSMCKHSIICINHIYYYVYIHILLSEVKIAFIIAQKEIM